MELDKTERREVFVARRKQIYYELWRSYIDGPRVTGEHLERLYTTCDGSGAVRYTPEFQRRDLKE